MSTFEAILLAIATGAALVNWLRVTELKDELAVLNAIVRHNQRTNTARYKELKGDYVSEYEEISRIYEEEETA